MHLRNRQSVIHFLKLIVPLLLFCDLILCRPNPEVNAVENSNLRTDKQLYEFLNNAQYFNNYGLNNLKQFSPDIGGQYGLGYSQPQFAFPRVQPQLVLYGPGGQGQPILINPGSPPGNFLVPSGGADPNFVLRGDIPSQQRPVFVAGYPKPAHIPPIEKDAEEIPTNPAKIPPLATGNPTVNNNNNDNEKPEKIETFNDSGNKDEDVDVILPKYPKLHPSSLQPGQRFFILNGGNVYSNFGAEEPQFGQGFNIIRYPQGFPSNINNQFDIEHAKAPAVQFKNYPNEQSDFGAFRFTPPKSSDILQYHDDPTNEAIIVEASFDDAVVSTRLKSPSEEKDDDDESSSMAQAGPSAVALAGPGGVAGSAPRGTAIVGKGGLAVVSPKATAVAGPQENENKNKNKRKPMNKKEYII